MAITDIKQYAHLTPRTSRRSHGSWTRFGLTSRSPAVSATPAISGERSNCSARLAVGGRAVLFVSRNRVAWGAGTAMLAPRRSSRTWNSGTTSFTGSGTG